MTDNDDVIVLPSEARPTSPSDVYVPGTKRCAYHKDDYKRWYQNAKANEQHAEEARCEARREADCWKREYREQLCESSDAYWTKNGRHGTPAEAESAMRNATQESRRRVVDSRRRETEAADRYRAAQEDRERAQHDYETYVSSQRVNRLAKWLALALMIAAIAGAGYTFTRNEAAAPMSVIEKSEQVQTPHDSYPAFHLESDR